MGDYFNLEDIDFKDKRVMIRLGTDVPIDEEGNILDDTRIKLALPTIKYVLERKAKQIILMCHLGRPKNNEDKFRTDKIAEKISTLLDERIIKVDGWGPIEGKIIFLENLRFHDGEKNKDEEKRDKFGKELASLADIFVQDAFSNCHRDHASMTSIPKFIPSCTGMLVEKEISIITSTLNNPERPFVSIIGGVKADKLNAIKNMSNKADFILVGGALAFTILKAQGYNVGKSKIDMEGLDMDFIEEIKTNEKIVLPVDAVVADKFSGDANTKEVSIEEIPKEWMALDIGPKSIEKYVNIIKNAKTVVWNGPIGVFEFKRFAEGTEKIAYALAELDAKVIIGGGDSEEAVSKLGLQDKMTHISSGGGASLTLFEGKKLIAIEALKENFKQFNTKE